jgi:hypothetical protein
LLSAASTRAKAGKDAHERAAGNAASAQDGMIRGYIHASQRADSLARN